MSYFARIVFGLACLLFLSGSCLDAQPLPPDRFVPGRLLIRFRETVSADQAKNLLNSMQARSTDEVPRIGVHIVQLPPNASETAYQNVLRGRPEVEFAELDQIRSHAQITPNDPYFPNQWHLARISASSAWSVTTGSTSVIIAIADTGVDSTHPDLSSKIVAGWNVNDNNSDTRDVYGHGTKVAGTAAAASNNGLGVASVAWNSWIMPVRVSLSNGGAYDSTIAKGITWAADHGASVVNVSYNVSGSSTVSTAAKYLYNKGGVVSVSAGNYGAFHTSPDDPYMITVGATDPNDVLYSWSDRGNDIDLAAPGCVTTTAAGGGYTGACGTSFSAPIAAGVAALVMSVKPSFTASQVISTLRNSADDLGPAGWDTTFGSGRVNAARAVSEISATDTQPPSVSFLAPASGAIVSGTVAIQVAASDNIGVTYVSVTVNGKTIGSSTNFSWDTTGRPNGSYTLAATAKDAAGNSATASQLVTVSNAGDTTPPTVSIISPLPGATISGNLALSVAAADNVGVVKVEYYCDGALIGTVTAAPFSYRWNTKKTTLGPHSLQARAYDVAGNVATSTAVSVIVAK